MDWYYEDYDYSPPPKEEDKSDLSWTQKICIHNWKATVLIISTVYDCTKCGIRKEDYDNYYKKYKG